jgi:hypothetical protein
MASKVLDLFTPVDPLIEYVPVKIPRDLVVLHFKVTILSVASFLCFALYSTYVFVLSPVPADLTSEIVFANTTKSALFQFSVSTLEDAVTCNFGPLSPFPGAVIPPPPSPHSRMLFQEPIGPPPPAPAPPSATIEDQYFFPLNNKMVRDPEKLKTKISYAQDGPPSPSQGGPPPIVFDSYKFPVFGTMDAQSLTSFVVVFNACPSLQVPLSGLPVVLSVSSNVDHDYESLTVKFPDPTKFIDAQVVADPNGDDVDFSSCLFYFSSTVGAIQSIDISLVKTVYGRRVKYSAALNCPPKFIPPPFSFFGDAKTQRIVAVVSPYVTVITYNDKNIPAFVGSLLGLFPIFLLIGGKVSSWIDSYKKSKQTVEDGISMTETQVPSEA